MAQLRLEHVDKIYDNKVQAVFDFNLDVKDGELIVLVGPSGCGKSTTLRMIAGLEDISRGHLFLDGKDITQTPAKDRDMAMVFQNYALYGHMTVYENMAFSLTLRKEDPNVIHKKVLAAAEILDLTSQLNKKPSQLSGGQRQRVAMGRSIVRNPKVFLFDEPLSNLDAKLRVQLRNELKRMQKEFGITTIYVTHDQEEALTLSDRIAVFNKGFIEQIGTPNEVYNHSKTEFVCNFIGDINRLSPEVSRALGADPRQHNYIRLERIHVNVEPRETDVALPGTVESMEYYGLYIKYTINLGCQSIKVIEKNDGVNIYEPGQQVKAVLNPRDVMAYSAEEVAQ